MVRLLRKYHYRICTGSTNPCSTTELFYQRLQRPLPSYETAYLHTWCQRGRYRRCKPRTSRQYTLHAPLRDAPVLSPRRGLLAGWTRADGTAEYFSAEYLKCCVDTRALCSAAKKPSSLHASSMRCPLDGAGTVGVQVLHERDKAERRRNWDVLPQTWGSLSRDGASLTAVKV